MNIEVAFFILVILLVSMLLLMLLIWAVFRGRDTSTGKNIIKKRTEKASRIQYMKHNDVKGTLVVDYKFISTFMDGVLTFDGKITIIISSSTNPAECYISDIQNNGRSLFKKVDPNSSNADKVNFSLDVLRKLRDQGAITPNQIYTIEELAKEVYEFNVLLKKGTVCLTKDWGYTYNRNA